MNLVLILGDRSETTLRSAGHEVKIRARILQLLQQRVGARDLDFAGRLLDVEAFDDAGLPTDNTLRATLRAYMEWAVADVLSYAPAGSVVPAGRPVPRWSWSGLETDSER